MSTHSRFSLRGRNPDVLTCIANLSNDEVFTPPDLANRMLDTLADAWAATHGGARIWEDPTVRFLDPCTKSGVLLREITRRLNAGLVTQLPDLEKRIEHILTKQVFGIAITRLTSLLARRSLYCSKFANGKHAVVKSFKTPAGNIWFERVEHDWVDGKCSYCGAPKAIFDRPADLDNHAYAFLHTRDIKALLRSLFGGSMQFDVVIGNPPYQMTGGAGGSSDSSIYHHFIEQAIRLQPRFVSMVVPSRWLVGGRGMDEFRATMFAERKLRALVDHPVSQEVFSGVEVKGGICYFLWDGAYSGPTEVTCMRDGEVVGPSNRELGEFDVFIRDERAVAILHQVLKLSEGSITEILTGDTPFGIATNFDDFETHKRKGDVALHYVRQGKRGIGFVSRTIIGKNVALLDKWKVLCPKAGSDGGQRIPDAVLGKPWIASPGSACTQTFIAFWVASEDEAKSLQSYIATKFFRFVVSLRKITQDALRGSYEWVPRQSWDRCWTDKMLYKKYGLTSEQVQYIESVIKPMELDNEQAN
jgi:site-specific DNA-methyltransferase (adenine-specific)